MNYYRRYIGDFQRKTMRLDPTDVGVYDLMLDYCYAEELPLPPEMDDIYSICRVSKPEHRKSVAKVLGLYFEQRSDGYHNKRVDEELGIALPAIEKQREAGATTAAKRWGKRSSTDSDENSLSNNSRSSSSDNSTDSSSNRASGSSTIQPLTTNHQPPTTNHQPSTTNQGQKREATRSAGASRLQLDKLPDEWRRYCESERPDLDPVKVFENFHDYWTAKPGKEGVKADWSATWRMWVRKEAKGKGGNDADGLLNRNLRAVGL